MKEIDWSKAPHGATHFRHDDPKSPWRMLKDGVWHAWFGGEWMTVTTAAEHFYIARPAWSGEGLPPVGTVCEFLSGGHWFEVEVKYSSEWLTVIKCLKNKPGSVIEQKDVELALEDFDLEKRLRPIRTPEQIAAEERLHNVRNACSAIADTLDSLRGKTKVERAALAVVEAMIDAGYSKVTP